MTQIPALASSGEYLSCNQGMALNQFNRLKRGQFTTEAYCDLHGLIESEACRYLEQFIEHHYEKGTRHILVIHGKGRRSESPYPVLKSLVNRLLRQNKSVLAFCSALPKAGGTGAVYIALKKRI